MAKILIGIPAYGQMPPETEEDYLRFFYYLGRRYTEHDFFVGIKRKAEQFRARNSIVKAAYQCGADYILMLDDDHVIDLEGTNEASSRYEFLRKLIEHHERIPEAGIIGALYYHRGGECRPVLMEEKDGQYFYLRDDQIKHGLQEVTVQGGGCMLIKSKVFDKIGAEPFEPEHEYGTDFQICLKARNAGFKIYCDTSIELGHVKNERSIVTSKNRHLHYSDYMNQDDAIRENAIMGRILREFRADVMEYLEVDSVPHLLEIAEQYGPHSKKFKEYQAQNNIKQYYIDSELAYLARACFIRCEDNQHRFDHFVLNTVKADVPGVGMDFGCGSAPISFELVRKGQVIYYYDIDGSAPFEFLKWRARKYGFYGSRAIFQEGPPPDGMLDYCLCLDSIEHLPDGEWQALIKRIAVALKHGGALITNFVLLTDIKNHEHIFTDRQAFIAEATKNGLWPLNTAIYQKMSDLNGIDP
jgi:2-polyprenyl-3-methyl-5-hydroxy-6-metoxy-1,4-benzoquinol methylase